MALSISFSLSTNTSFFCLLLFLLSFLKGAPVYGATGTHKSYHTAHVKSLDPNPYCLESTRDQSKKESLKVVHKYGPCSHQNQDETITTPTLAEIMAHDQSRVNSIHNRLSIKSTRNSLEESKATIPAQSGRSIGTGNYIVTIGFGTPKKELTLIFDTGSSVSWIQCLPCISCYQQQQPIFNTSASQSYKNASCNSTQCSEVKTTTGISGCARATNTCIYAVVYGDNSYTLGFFGTETLTLTPSDIFPNFYFGCGLNNTGLFRGAAGLLGLGRSPLSVISQTASKYGNYFSYCLPTFSSSSGFLIFGQGRTTSTALKFTPLLTNSNEPSFYFIDLIGIKVAGQTLSISESVFKTPGTIIDSGTVTTRLQPTAYTALRTRFRQLMMNYTRTQNVSLFDTCYDFSNTQTVNVPSISFLFGGDIEVPIDFSGILYGNKTVGCLAFAGNSDPSDVGIFGNLQQQTLDVVYDVAGGKLGFGQGGCS